MISTALIHKKILDVEDDSSCQRLMEIFLEEVRCTFEIVGNGQEAVNKVRTEKVDVVLMDVRMPVMDGYAASSAIREMDKVVPIIAMTGDDRAWEGGKCQAYGMNDCLIKPFTKEQVIEKLLKWSGVE